MNVVRSEGNRRRLSIELKLESCRGRKEGGLRREGCIITNECNPGNDCIRKDAEVQLPGLN